jgi:hypothetical protein
MAWGSPVPTSEKYYYLHPTPNRLPFLLSWVDPAARVVHQYRNSFTEGDGRTWELKRTC